MRTIPSESPMKSSAGYRVEISGDDPTSALRVQITALQDTLMEVPVPQRELDVFLDIPRAGLVQEAVIWLLPTDPERTTAR